jgi:Ca2+-binding EF-hand superfamily protein
MSLTGNQLREVVDSLFTKYDENKNGFLELRELTQLINLTLRHNNASKKFTMSDAREFMKIADNNSDEKLSREELFVLFQKVMQRTA